MKWIEHLCMRYLRKREWVVFYLPEISRHCSGDTCWLELYEAEQRREETE